MGVTQIFHFNAAMIANVIKRIHFNFNKNFGSDHYQEGALLVKILYLENLMLETTNCAMKTVA